MATGTTSEMVMIQSDGLLLDHKTIVVPPPPPGSSRELEWTESGVGVLDITSTRSSDPSGKQTLQSQLEFSFYNEAGLQAGPVALLPTPCMNCSVIAGIRYLDGNFLVLHGQRPVLGAPPSETSAPLFMVVSADGEIKLSGTLDWFPSGMAMMIERFQSSVHTDSAVVSSLFDVWLVDGSANRLSSSVSMPTSARFDWDLSRSEISEVWLSDGDLLMQRFDFTGRSILEANRLSSTTGHVTAVVSADVTGTTFTEGNANEYFAETLQTGKKLGGDLPLTSLPTDISSVDNALLLRSMPGEFLYFRSSSGSLARQRITCAQ
jgi:hypothetical protein